MGETDKPIVCYVTDRKALSTPPGADSVSWLLEKLRLAVRAGADWVQIREKDLPGGTLLALTREAVSIAQEARKRSSERAVGIYLNDRLDVALAAGMAGGACAAGVHLGGESLPLEDVVRWRRAGNAPPEFQIGVSCHSPEDARRAERGGANYVFFGPIFDTPSKRAFGAPQGLERLREVCREIRIPVIAIGGIDETNGEECIRAGASGVAAIRVFQEAADAEALKEFISKVHGAREKI